jgi:hypothetical protein
MSAKEFWMSCYQRRLEQKELRVLLPTEENPKVKADKPDESMETLQCEGAMLWRL